MKVKFTLSIGVHNASQEEVFDTDSDLNIGENPTDEELDDAYIDWRSNFLDGWWHSVEDDE